MRHMKKAFLILMALVIIIIGGCGVNKSETSRNVVYKPRDVVENDISDYLKKKYNKDFDVAVMDSPNHIYSSYSAEVYPDDDRTVSFQASIVYTDDNNYNVADNYLIYSLKDDLEVWFGELAAQIINGDFKVFFMPMDELPLEYQECKNIQEFLEASKRGTYYGLRFYVVLPDAAFRKDIVSWNNQIAAKMLEQRIRGQVTLISYKDQDVYDQIQTKKDERYFWSYDYENINCTSTIQSDFHLDKAELRHNY